MTNEELKNKIKSNTLDDKVLILKYKDNKFICNEYIDYIAKSKNLQKIYVEKLSDIDDSSDFFDDTPTYLYVYDVDKLETYVNPEFKNVIVVCKEVVSEQDIDFIDMVKTENWQVEEFVKSRLTGLNEEEVKWLCTISGYDIYKLDKECEKLEIFNNKEQEALFNELNNESGYSHLNSMNIFNFTEAIMKKDYNLINILIPNITTCDLEPLGVVTILLKKFKQIVGLQNPKATAQSLGMSDRQFWYLRNHPNNCYSNNKVIENIEFLTSMDSKVKSGQLDLSREELLDYIITGILN